MHTQFNPHTQSLRFASIGPKRTRRAVDLNKKWDETCTDDNLSLFCEAGRHEGVVKLLTLLAVERKIPYDIKLLLQKLIRDYLMEADYTKILQLFLKHRVEKYAPTSAEMGEALKDLEPLLGLGSVKLPTKLIAYFTSSIFLIVDRVLAFVEVKLNDAFGTLDLDNVLRQLHEFVNDFAMTARTRQTFTKPAKIKSLVKSLSKNEFPTWPVIHDLLTIVTSLQTILTVVAFSDTEKLKNAFWTPMAKSGVWGKIKEKAMAPIRQKYNAQLESWLTWLRRKAVDQQHMLEHLFYKFGVRVIGFGVIRLSTTGGLPDALVNPYVFDDPVQHRKDHYKRYSFLTFKRFFDSPLSTWVVEKGAKKSFDYWGATLLESLGYDLAHLLQKSNLRRFLQDGKDDVDWSRWIGEVEVAVPKIKTHVASINEAFRNLHKKSEQKWLKEYQTLVLNSMVGRLSNGVEALRVLLDKFTKNTDPDFSRHAEFHKRLRAVQADIDKIQSAGLKNWNK